MPLSSQQVVLTTASLVTVTTLVSAYFIYKRSSRRHGNGNVVPGNRAWDGRAIWRQMRQVIVVDNAEDCERAVSKLLTAIEHVKVTYK